MISEQNFKSPAWDIPTSGGISTRHLSDCYQIRWWI